MKTALRSLFVWLLLLALPLQGMAAGRMLPCVGNAHASAAPAVRAPAAHDPVSMLGKQAVPCALHMAHADHPAHDGHSEQSPQHGHGGSGCGFCCVGVALAPAAPAPLALAPPDFIAIPFRAGHVTSADPAVPERPPRSLSA